MKEIVEVRKSKYNGKYDKAIEIQYKSMIAYHMIGSWKAYQIYCKNDWQTVKKNLTGYYRDIKVPTISNEDELNMLVQQINAEIRLYDYIISLGFRNNSVTVKNVQTLTNPKTSMEDVVEKIDKYLADNPLDVTVVLKTAAPYGEVATIYQANPTHEARLEIKPVSHRISDDFISDLKDSYNMFPEVKWSDTIKRKIEILPGRHKFHVYREVYYADGSISECTCLMLMLSDYKPKLKYIKKSK